ncbi:Immunoglobulin subtype,Immunoglobulin-like domain,Immunoglobulin-like fold,Immunoglobulin subtype [Cinara cedri]|uniref:Immunoglobulin subtype,Immunoglobulin-like domain,Immunoglobulin-like fold,Immunoglobulin subtype n=1 Tax=Cinara cedri TaxID=506608 RepID=A0A5E4M3E6_9HEMI|nr:Immunoglobulin subtype,Immunoglobulin-like domain,Immunoglobulin-like fold,Immunoglobulin subtype [Cinara cedri]
MLARITTKGIVAVCGRHYDQRPARRKRRELVQCVPATANRGRGMSSSSAKASSSSSTVVAGGMIAVLLLSTSALYGAWAYCPAACECKWRGGKESAICSEANLTAVPRQLDSGTQLLDLNGNTLYRLGKDAFADAGLLNLQKLYMSRCKIKSLDQYVFRKLSNLVELDLSHNNIPTVPSVAFESVPELRELRLDGNPIMKVPNRAFEHVRRLVRLDVSNCKVALLETTAFSGLEKSLEWLRFDNNQLREVKSITITSLTGLHGVQLNNNPWNCSCKLRPLREWMLKRNVPYGAPPVCKAPARLAGTPWDKLDLDDFACEPHSVPVAPVVVVTEGDNVTVSCRMFGMPIPSSRWSRNDRPVGQTARNVPVTEGRYTNLTIVSTVAQDGGRYVCELENRSGSSRANVTVVVVKRSPELALTADRYALPGLIVGVILVLSFCLIFLCGLAIRTKGSPARYASNGIGAEVGAGGVADPFDRYEKIEMNHEDKTADVQQQQQQQQQPPVPSSDKNGRVDPPDYADSMEAATAFGGRRRRADEEDYDRLPPAEEPPASKAPSATDRPTARPSHPTTSVPRRPRILPDDPKDGKAKTYLECNLGEVTLHHHVLHKESLPVGQLYTTAAGRQELCNTNKNVPDLLDTLVPAKNRRISQTLPRSTYSSNNRRNTVYVPKASESQSPLLLGSRSSGGSNTSRSQLSFDSSVSPDRPRKLSAGQKASSYLNLSTTEICGDRSPGGYHHQHHPSYYWTPPSLPSSPARERRLPATPVGRGAGGGSGGLTAETPILDPLSSRRRPYGSVGNHTGNHHYHSHSQQQLTGSNHSLLSSSDGASVTYDYHTAQLDMFLDEYKTLRKELTKMQRTCDTLRLSNASLASSTSALDVINNHHHHHHRHHQVNLEQTPSSLPHQQPSSNMASSSSPSSMRTPKSILKNKNQATYVYRAGTDHRRNSYHLLDPPPDDVYLS